MTFELHNPAALLKSLTAFSREQNWLEFKRNTFSSDKVGQYVSGLANAAMLEREQYAFMIWGIDDETHDIVGTTVRLDREKVGNEPFLHWLDKVIRPKINIQHYGFKIDDKHVEMLVIDPAYSQPVTFNGKEYIRVDTSLKPLTEHVEKNRALWQITSSYSFENSTIISHATIDDIFSHFGVDAFLKGMKIEDRSRGNMLEILEDKGLIKENMQGGYEVFAILALCCARDLNEFPLLSNKGARVITYKNSDKLKALDDVEGKRGYLIGFTNILSHIMSKIPSEEKLVGGIRNKVYKVPEDTVREFLANALIHQDFTLNGSRPTIEIYKDRIRFLNPGIPLIDVDRFIDGGARSRNPNFAKLMRLAGLCEERGSGVDRAVKEIEKAALPPPLFASIENQTSVTAFMPRPFAQMSAEERVRACFQHAQIMHEQNEAMSNASLRHRFGLPDKAISQVSVVIRDAIDAGRIKPLREGQAPKMAKYVPSYV